jgi:hypothetical protein
MAAKSHVVGQIAIPLPPQMLRRSLAWQARRDQRAEYRADFDEARVHGLRIRHVMKQVRLDTDESLRELGLMPPAARAATARAATARAVPPTNHPPAETRPPTRTATTLTARAPVDRAVVDRPTSPTAVAEPTTPNPDSLRIAPPESSDIAPVPPMPATGARPAPTASARSGSSTTVTESSAMSAGPTGPVSSLASTVAAPCARPARPADPASKGTPCPTAAAIRSPVAGAASHHTSSVLGAAVPAAASGAGGRWLRAPPILDTFRRRPAAVALGWCYAGSGS